MQGSPFTFPSKRSENCIRLRRWWRLPGVSDDASGVNILVDDETDSTQADPAPLWRASRPAPDGGRAVPVGRAGIRGVKGQRIVEAAGCSSLLIEGRRLRGRTRGERAQGRQRWSFAHEIVHTCFREVDPRAPSSPEQESPCDVGAAELTMPTARFREALRGEILCLELVRALSAEFETSFVAAGRRAAELSDEPACFLTAWLRRSARQEPLGTGRPRLRVEDWSASTAWFERPRLLDPSFEKGRVIPEAFSLGEEYSRVSRPGHRPPTARLRHRGGRIPLPLVGASHRGRVAAPHCPACDARPSSSNRGPA